MSNELLARSATVSTGYAIGLVLQGVVLPTPTPTHPNAKLICTPRFVCRLCKLSHYCHNSQPWEMEKPSAENAYDIICALLWLIVVLTSEGRERM